MSCGTSFRGPKADTGADINKVINVGRGPMSDKNLNLKLKMIFFFFFSFKGLLCLVYFSNIDWEILFASFFHTPIMIFH